MNRRPSKKAPVSKNSARNRQHEGGKGDNDGEDDDADNINNSESDSEDGSDSDNDSNRPSTKEEYHSLVSAELVRQLMELAPVAMGKRVSKSFPYKLWGQFALENRLRIKGWPMNDVAVYPGDRNLKLSELVIREWRVLFNAVLVSGRLCIERWAAGMFFLKYFEPLELNEIIQRNLITLMQISGRYRWLSASQRSPSFVWMISLLRKLRDVKVVVKCQPAGIRGRTQARRGAKRRARGKVKKQARRRARHRNPFYANLSTTRKNKWSAIDL